MRKNSRSFAGEFTVFLVMFTFAAFANSDWPQFRGPNRDGISTEPGLLKQWPAGGPPLAWKTTGLGTGYSTLSVAANRIFTIGDQADTCFVICLSTTDGAPLWKTPLAKSGAPGWGSFEGPRNSPTIDG